MFSLGKLGWLVAFLYTACAALRLARFNTQLGVADKKYFQGLPSPSAAAVVASSVWISNKYGLDGKSINYLVAGLTAFAGMLMVSNVRYSSFKELDFKGRVPFVAIFFVVLLFVGIAVNPPVVLFFGFSIYAISGPVLTLVRLQKTKRSRKKN